MNGLHLVLDTLPWYAWIAIVAILGGAATRITLMIFKHREEMERIKFGDSPPARKDLG